MIRIVIENLLLLLLPTLIYVSYVYLTRDGRSGSRNLLDDAPLVWLFLAGVALAMAVLVIFGSTSGEAPHKGYQPPEFRDGKIIPGRVRDNTKPNDG